MRRLSRWASSPRKSGSGARKTKTTALPCFEFSETEIFEEEEEGNVDDAGEGESKSDVAGDSPSSPLPGRIDVAVEPDDSETVEDESRDRRRQEAEWRNRFREARERVALAREQKAVWDGVHYVEGIKLVDENGNVVVESLDDLRRFVAQASQELTEAERALKKAEEEARRAGVPPGWLR